MNCYVHIPFCDGICYYCDFCRFVSKNRKEYLDALEREITSLSFSKLDTLYFGGGTPSILDKNEFIRISELFKDKLSESYEWTVECNPESLTMDKCELYSSLGVNRISLGVQTFNDNLLKSIGRKHSSLDVFHCISNLRDSGISNISIDLIYGLPNQSLDDIKSDLNIFLELDLPHLSIYSLQVEENSVFGKKGVESCDEELEADMYDTICDVLNENGYIHYEISSFCKEGQYSKHNLCYWNDRDFIGIGCGASGRENGIRYDHTRSLKEYIQDPIDKQWIDTSMKDKEFEAIMMSLRTVFGLDVATFDQKYKTDFFKVYKEALEKYKNHFKIDGSRVYLDAEGMKILNTILVDFL